MKIAILQSPAFRVLILSCLITITGLLGFSISSYDKGGSFPLLLVISEFLIGLGGIATLISLVICLVIGFGAILQRRASGNKHTGA